MDENKEIKILFCSDGSTTKINIPLKTTLEELKNQISIRKSIEPQYQRLFHLGREIKNCRRSLSALGIGNFNSFVLHLHSSQPKNHVFKMKHGLNNNNNSSSGASSSKGDNDVCIIEDENRDRKKRKINTATPTTKRNNNMYSSINNNNVTNIHGTHTSAVAGGIQGTEPNEMVIVDLLDSDDDDDDSDIEVIDVKAATSKQSKR